VSERKVMGSRTSQLVDVRSLNYYRSK